MGNLQQPSPPLWYLEHDCPPRSRDGPFSIYGGFDFGEFSLYPFHVRAIIVQALQDAQRFILLVFFDEMARGFGEPKHSYEQHECRKCLEREWESPLQGVGVGCMKGTVSNPPDRHKYCSRKGRK